MSTTPDPGRVPDLPTKPQPIAGILLEKATRRGFVAAAGTLAAASVLAEPARAAAAATRHPHKYEELMPEEFYDEQRRAPIIQLKKQSPERLEAIQTANAALGNRFLNLAAERMAKLAGDLLQP